MKRTRKRFDNEYILALALALSLLFTVSACLHFLLVETGAFQRIMG